MQSGDRNPPTRVPPKQFQSLFILTGAGISAESGVATFRDANGLWENHDIMQVASPEGFRRHPALVHRFYDARRAQLHEIEPNAAHLALARLQRQYDGQVTLVTQNVDDLHERAGSQVIHMHGELRRARCVTCHSVWPWNGPLAGAHCPACKQSLRPHIVWFGEIPQHGNEIEATLLGCDLFVSIGTSGAVYPAAGYVQAAHEQGAKTLEINLEATSGTFFDERWLGPATQQVPVWVDSMLGC